MASRRPGAFLCPGQRPRPRCHSPPFPVQTPKIRRSERTMEITINYYGQAVSVSVEVYEYLTQADHKAENLAHEQRRHWDGREFDEYIIATEGRLPYCATPARTDCCTAASAIPRNSFAWRPRRWRAACSPTPAAVSRSVSTGRQRSRRPAVTVRPWPI